MKFKHLVAGLTAVLLSGNPALANQPIRYTATCHLEAENGATYTDQCVVIETRTASGGLNTRNIFSDRLGLTVKGSFRDGLGYMTWDSHNKFEYKWEYKPGKITGSSYVMPGVSVENLSWD
jgi:hypothetical protein